MQEPSTYAATFPRPPPDVQTPFPTHQPAGEGLGNPIGQWGAVPVQQTAVGVGVGGGAYGAASDSGSDDQGALSEAESDAEVAFATLGTDIRLPCDDMMADDRADAPDGDELEAVDPTLLEVGSG